MAFPENQTDGKVKIIVFGPGFGESAVIGIPGLGWGVIDSCQHTVGGKKNNPSLEYLRNRSVNRLAFIVLTHPHSDHYEGLDQIIDYYIGNIDRLCYYSGEGIREYRMFLARKQATGNKGIIALANIFKKFEEAKRKGATIIRTGERTEIIRSGVYGDKNIEILALSPSAENVQKYVEILFRAIPRTEQDVEAFNNVGEGDHNLISTAIWMKIDRLGLLFGGDCADWKGVITNVDAPDLSVQFVKVPHHGSENAFHKPAWIKFGQNGKPFSVVTPYARLKDPLPREDMIRKIRAYSETVAITSRTKTVKPSKVYDRTVVKRLAGVKNWRCIAESDNAGSVDLACSSEDGKIVNVDIREPAFLWHEN